MRRHLILCGVLWLASCAVGQTAYNFSTPFAFGTGLAIDAMTTANLFGSPAPDFILCNKPTGQVAIYENMGPGLPPIFRLVASVIGQPQSVATGDVDADGDNDVVTAGPSGVSILTNNGTTLLRADYPSMAGSFVHLRIVDVDQDGDVDIVRGSLALMRVGTAWTTVAFATASGSTFDGILADFEGDGDLDLYRIQSTGLPIQVFLNNGGAAFGTTPLVTFPWPFPGRPAKGAVADVNGDGRDDIVFRHVAASAGSFIYVTAISALLSTGTSFQVMPYTPSCPAPGVTTVTAWSEPYLRDINGDGLPDVLTSTNLPNSTGAPLGSQSVESFLNTGSGVFVDRTTFHATATLIFSLNPDNIPPIVAVDDFDLDGDMDVAVVGPPNQRFTLFFHSGSTSGATNPQATIAISSGDQQSSYSGWSLFQPCVVSVTDPSGQPLVGTDVTFVVESGPATLSVPTATNPNFTATGVCKTTDANGLASVSILGILGQSGTVVVRATTSDANSVVFQLFSGAVTWSVISGNNQSALVGAVFGLPCVARATDIAGQPIAGLPLNFSAIGSVSIGGVTSGATNSSGEVSLTATAGSSAGTPTVLVLTPTGQVVASFSLNVFVPNLTAISGTNQATDWGESWPIPLVVAVTDPSGQPIANHPVRFQPIAPGIIAGGTQVVTTDAQGLASLTASTASPPGGLIVVKAVSPAAPSGPSVTFNLFARRFDATFSSGGSQLTLTYRHEEGPQPFILAIDNPQPSSIVTPYGIVWTSIMSPTSTAVIFDPLGLSGIYDPGMVANPVFTRTYAVPPGLAGVTRIGQVYGFDPTYAPDYTLAIFVSNAIAIMF